MFNMNFGKSEKVNIVLVLVLCLRLDLREKMFASLLVHE